MTEHRPEVQRPKAADIDDAEFLRAVDGFESDGQWGTERRWVSIWELEPVFPAMPAKVVAAKFRQLLKRGLIDGCPCGCRGDLHLTLAGFAFLREVSMIEGA